MTLTAKQRKVSLELSKAGYIPNWYSNFGKPALRIYLNENDEEEILFYFSVTNIYYDYRLDLPSNETLVLCKAIEIINEVFPENKDSKYNYMKKFDSSNFQSLDLNGNED